MKGYGIISQILEQDEVPIGFCLYQTVQDEAEVLTLGIVPTARQQSHGHLLLQQGEKYLSEHHVSRLFLEVSSANTAALTLYKKNNFQKIGLRKNYYIENKKKFDAIIMSKLLYKPYS